MEYSWTSQISMRLARLSVLIAFGVGTVLSVAQVYLDYLTEGNALVQKIEESQRAFKPAATRVIFLLDEVLAKEVVTGFMQYDYVKRATILDEYDNVLATEERDTVAENPELNLTRVLIDNTDVYRYELELPEARGNPAGQLVLEVDRAVGMAPFMSRATTIFLSGLLRNFLLAMLLYIAFHAVIAKPLHSLVEQISKIDPEQPGEDRLRLGRQHENSEFGKLIRQINQSFDAMKGLLDNLRMTNRALSTSEEALRMRSWELEQEIERTRRTSQQLMQTKEQAEAANRAKSLFLANVSHELRTPLNAIIGFSSLMGDEIYGPVGHEKYRSYIQDILDSSRHLADVLGEVLDLAKIEASEVKIEDEDIDLKRLCTEVAALIRSQANEKRLKVSLDVADNLPHLRGDRIRVKQSLLNVLSNAVKFTPKGKEGVGVSAQLEADGHLSISVRDDGIGIAKDEQDLIFSPFIRSSTAHSRSHEGTGLGLSLVKAFIEMHDGWITLDSEPDQGSVFTIHFPIERIINVDQVEMGKVVAIDSAE